MKLYLSSYKIGDNPARLKELLPENSQAVYVSNALDFARPESQQKHEKWDLRELKEIGVDTKPLDLRHYFSKKEDLKNKLENIDLIYVSGGNVFDLRLAMKLSGFDEILKSFQPSNKVYAGYSAAGCVLSPTLKGYDIVDKPNLTTYGDHETIWDGLGMIDFQFAPHFESDHPESSDINKEIAYFQKHEMEHKALRDGEVITLEL